jgi:hypothetical protein
MIELNCLENPGLLWRVKEFEYFNYFELEKRERERTRKRVRKRASYDGVTRWMLGLLVSTYVPLDEKPAPISPPLAI